MLSVTLKMLRVLVLLITLVLTVDGESECPAGCECQEVMACKCVSNDDPFTLLAVNSNTESVLIEKCDQVITRGSPFKGVTKKMKGIEIKNCNRVQFGRKAFNGVNASLIRLSQISHLTLGFMEGINSDELDLLNVHIDHLPSEYRNLTDHDLKLMSIKTMRIRNSTINVLDIFSFGMSPKTLEISDCRIGLMKSNAFLYSGIERLNLTSNAINDTEPLGIETSDFTHVSITRNDFLLVKKYSISTTNSAEFIFANNVMHKVIPSEVGVVDLENVARVTFTDNRFLNSTPGITITSGKIKMEVNVAGNEFECDCALSWIWNETVSKKASEFFTPLLESSKCSGPDRLKDHPVKNLRSDPELKKCLPPPTTARSTPATIAPKAGITASSPVLELTVINMIIVVVIFLVSNV